jgi:fatty acid desaturase
MDSGNRAIVVILAAVVVLAALVWLFGYPLLVWLAVLSAFSALAFIVFMAADLGAKPKEADAEPKAQPAPRAQTASAEA